MIATAGHEARREEDGSAVTSISWKGRSRVREETAREQRERQPPRPRIALRPPAYRADCPHADDSPGATSPDRCSTSMLHTPISANGGDAEQAAARERQPTQAFATRAGHDQHADQQCLLHDQLCPPGTTALP